MKAGQEPLHPLVEWIEHEAGLRFPDIQEEIILRAASKNALKLGIPADEYTRKLNESPAERRAFFSEITIGETYFFREERQFALLLGRILPAFLSEGGKISLWSAGCSTGEEALSLACSLETAIQRAGSGATYSVFASDISERALSILQRGRYGKYSFRNDGKRWHPLLDAWGTWEGEAWEASPAILGKIEHSHRNLLRDPLPPPESLDIIFFRNTLLYMRLAWKGKILARVVECLKPGGYLFVGSAEVPSIDHPQLQVEEEDGVFYFRKALKRQRLKPNPKARSLAGDKVKSLAASVDTAPVNRAERGSHPVSNETIDLILKKADIILENGPDDPPAQAEPSLEGRSAAIVAAIARDLAEGRPEEASERVCDLEGLIQENALSLYLAGRCRKALGRTEEALGLWIRALAFDPSFWPASFHAGLALMSPDPRKSRSLLADCLEALDNQGERNHIRVLLDAFDSSYFRKMARRLLERLGE